MKASKKQSKPQARGRSLHPVVRRPTRVGWYWVSDDECKTWQPCIVYKYKNRFWGRNFDRGMWPLAKSAGLRWGGQIYPPNASHHDGAAPAPSVDGVVQFQK